MKIAVLAVQGAFIEHEKMLSGLGVECLEIRQTAGQLLYRRRSKRCGENPYGIYPCPLCGKCRPDAEIIAEVEGNIVGVKYGNQIGISFHPEVTDCTKVHEYFLQICKEHKQAIGA